MYLERGSFKKRLRKVLSFILSLTIIISSIGVLEIDVRSSQSTDERYHVTMADGDIQNNVVGEMFLVKDIFPKEAEHLIDNSGMSGIEAPNHMHSCVDTNDAGSKNLSQKSQYLGGKESITIDLGVKQSLGEMYIWNYNDIRHLEYGMKDIKIEYSEDGEKFYDGGVHTLSQCSKADNDKYYGNVASTVDFRKSFDFDGVTGRYVKITPISNFDGSNFYGLAEIRIFRHKTEPCSGQSITVDAFAPMQLDNNTVTNAFNYSGMTLIDSSVSDNEKHSNRKQDMCVLNGNSIQSLLVMNLDGNYPISAIKIWNYNEPTELNIGIREFEIWYTTGNPCDIITYEKNDVNDGEQDKFDFSGGDWKKLGNYTLPKGDGSDEMSCSMKIDFKGKHAQHIKIVPKNNYNNQSVKFGLSEVKVYVEKGWATEYSREWTGMVSSSGEFSYQGNRKADTKGTSLMPGDNERGWIGGDGIHGTSLNGGQTSGSANGNSKTIFTFQDSFEGNFGNYETFSTKYGFGGTGNDGKTGFSIGMRNMAYMMLTGDEPDPRNMQYYMKLNGNLSDSHEGGNILPGRYWIGDSTVVNNSLYTIANHFSGLTILGADFFATPLLDNGFPDMGVDTVNNLVQTKIDDTGIVYHENILEEGDWIYLYGKGLKECGIEGKMVVSRVLKNKYPNLKSEDISYWDGQRWVSDYKKATAITTFQPGNEWNITYMDKGTFAGKYILVNTAFSITGSVGFAVADTPMGPFVEPDESRLYYATEPYKLWMRYYQDSKTIFRQWNYNAKSQPAISKSGELLFTYHFGVHDDRTVIRNGKTESLMPSWGFFNSTCKEYEHPTFVKMFDIMDETEKTYSQNLAILPQTTVSASAENITNGQIAEKVRDGNRISDDSRWSTYIEGNSSDLNHGWIEYDMHQNVNISQVKIYWEAACGVDYEIQVKEKENDAWRTVSTKKNGTGGVDEFEIKGAEDVRFIRMKGSKSAQLLFGNFGYSMYEFEVYGNVKAENAEEYDNVIQVTKDNVLTLGKTFVKNDMITFSYANSGVEINFYGTGMKGDFVVEGNQRIAVFIDDNILPEDAAIFELKALDNQDENKFEVSVQLAKGLAEGEHKITIRKMDRGYHGFLAANTVGIKNITLPTDGKILEKSPAKKLVIEAFGDSITNGDALYDLGNGQSAAYSWKGYIGELTRMYNADIRSCGISGNGLLRSVLKDDNGIYFNLFTPQKNWSVIDESAGAESNIKYNHTENPADVVIINLGTNDNAAFMAGQITAHEFKTEYLRFINEIHHDCPEAVVIGCLGAMGAEGLFAPIREAVEEANSKAGMTYAYFVELKNSAAIENGKGYDNSHPSAIAGKYYAEQISDVIEKSGVLERIHEVRLEINGYQISTANEGHRVAYSIDAPKNQVEKIGLIYAFEDRVTKDEMVVENLNDNVFVFEATENGKTDYDFMEGDNVQSYVATMKFIKVKDYYNAKMRVRAFAKLKDGTYIYSDESVSSVYEISDYLYKTNRMNTFLQHQYLYENILKVCDFDYEKIDYNWNNAIVN